MINPPTGLYVQLSSNDKNKLTYLDINKIDINKINEYVNAYMWWGPPKEAQQEDKLLKNVDICLELIDRYEKRIS